ncbi:hypothetical protein MHSWG343_09540 [Candidatus Mycoplasma haematohominis]|uniref:NusB/RsmB/TIM44 domain-containing protein n=1 Tax=Candidatus Mycoplasma haematohominis TaxID=1494318 RepID=A0A478FRX2_9MOLU|nr:hypothetical protein MHSWG343_09540 [Candidatus Mycoplasma haemohominis]
MKEEIFLFYKQYLEPRFNLSWSYLTYLAKNLFHVRVFPAPKQKPVVFQYLLFVDNNTTDEKISFYTNQGIQPVLLRTDEINALNKDHFYLVLGQFKEIEENLRLLRQCQVKAWWDQIYMEADNKKPVWKRRVSIVEAIYADLMTEKLKNKEKLDVTEERKEWIDFEKQIFDKYLRNKEDYKQIINRYLKEGWEWERINPITVSILLEAISESQTFDTPKLVLITQSIKTAKNYCGNTEYRIVHALLDNYFKETEH